MSTTKVIIIDYKIPYGIMRYMEKLHTVNETLELLRISRPTLYRFIKSGQLVPLKMGKKTLFTESELTRFLEDLKRK